MAQAGAEDNLTEPEKPEKEIGESLNERVRIKRKINVLTRPETRLNSRVRLGRSSNAR